MSNVVKLAYRLKKLFRPYSAKIEIAGSIRRKALDPRDVDILLVPRTPEALCKEKIATVLDKLGIVTRHGDKIISVVINRISVDVYYVDNKSWGAMLLALTGPAGYDIYLRSVAKKKGYLLSQYGLFNRKTKRWIAGKTEKDIYKKLNIHPEMGYWREPRLRGTGR